MSTPTLEVKGIKHMRNLTGALLARAIVWAEAQSKEISLRGTPLDPWQLGLASAVGVVQPDLIRVREVYRVPVPNDPELREIAVKTGLFGPTMAGITFGYSIYMVNGCVTNRLISHECRHVQQYEAAGSIAAFVPVYLQQIVAFGYDEAPLEIDARLHERDSAEQN